MLSPDNYVHTDLGTQGYNRYAYAGNNPMRYVDPSGEVPVVVPFIVAGILGGSLNLVSNWHKVDNFQTGFAYFTSGAVGGAMSLVQPGVGAAITAYSNVAIDAANGHLPNFSSGNGADAALYFGGVILDGLSARMAGKMATSLVNIGRV